MALLGLVAVTLIVYSAAELDRFRRAESRRSTVIYAAGERLAPGVDVQLIGLASTLARLKYTETRTAPTAPGQFSRSAGGWDIALRGDGRAPAGTSNRVHLDMRGSRIAHLTRDGHVTPDVTLEGEVLTSAAEQPGEERRPVRLADVPIALLNAVLAVEDHRFFEHRGLDLRGLLRAAWANTRARRITQGGSTITQQLVKNRLLTSERTFLRKINEAWLAMMVEWRYSKETILEAYLNDIYLGQHGPLAIRGVGAAARAYFGKEVHQLTLGESALLAGLIRAPNSYSPALDPARARRRRDAVLQRMHELGSIGTADVARASAEVVRAPAPASAGQPAPYFSDYVRQELEDVVGLEQIEGTRTARVFTSLDLTLQRFAEIAMHRGLDRLESRFPRLRRANPGHRVQAALVVLDLGTGEIRALVGGRDYQSSQFNRATLGRRQPGSAFKPIVFLTAIQPRDGRPTFTAASPVDDTPITVATDQGPWTPRNYEGRYEGRVSVRRAIERSLNAATLRIALAVGLPAVVDTARALGIHGELKPVPALALGSFEVTPLELARAYVPMANGGVRPGSPSAVRAVITAEGALEVAGEPAAKVISPAESYLMTSLLQGVVDSGTAATARALGVTGHVAGKTGTTNDARDAWFVGYSSRLLALVWVGFDSGEAHGLSGSEAAVPIWADFMRQTLDAYPAPAFTVPAGIATAQIDAGNGKLATPYCPVTRREIFIVGTEPPPCDEHTSVVDQAIHRARDIWQRLRDWWGR